MPIGESVSFAKAAIPEALLFPDKSSRPFDGKPDANFRSGAMNILVIHYRFIGDTVLTAPFFRNLRRAEPKARIVWLHGPGDTEVIKGIPYVDEFILWDPRNGPGGRQAVHGRLSAKIRFVLELRRHHFDKVYVLKRSVSSGLLGIFSGARRRIGFNTEKRGLLLTRRISYQLDRHYVENLLDVLRADGIMPADNHLELWLTSGEKEFANDFLSGHGIGPDEKIIGLHPFCTKDPRAWHEDDFASVANELQRVHRARVIIFGSKQDSAQAARLKTKIHPAPVNAAGETTLRQSVALMARCSLLICNDSGLMHVGAALGIPLVALFGPGTPAKFGPHAENARIIYQAFPCSPCRQNFYKQCLPSARNKPACLEAISVRQVLDVINTLHVFPAALG